MQLTRQFSIQLHRGTLDVRHTHTTRFMYSLLNVFVDDRLVKSDKRYVHTLSPFGIGSYTDTLLLPRGSESLK